jgi:hypothetical protein
MVPEAAEFFLRAPQAQRRGRVFRLNRIDTGAPIDPHHVGKLVGMIGEKAGVVVDPTEGKTATIHDLRRTFGSKWARKVMPAVLQRLMRHASIQTTMRYYIDLNVDEMADELWASHKTGPESHISSHIGPAAAENEASQTIVSDYLAYTSDSEGDGNRTRNHRIDSLKMGLPCSTRVYVKAFDSLDLRLHALGCGRPKVTSTL